MSPILPSCRPTVKSWRAWSWTSSSSIIPVKSENSYCAGTETIMKMWFFHSSSSRNSRANPKRRSINGSESPTTNWASTMEYKLHKRNTSTREEWKILENMEMASTFSSRSYPMVLRRTPATLEHGIMTFLWTAWLKMSTDVEKKSSLRAHPSRPRATWRARALRIWPSSTWALWCSRRRRKAAGLSSVEWFLQVSPSRRWQLKRTIASSSSDLTLLKPYVLYISLKYISFWLTSEIWWVDILHLE